MKKNKLELLAPAGSYDIFKAVLNAGADAVYVGGNRFGARAYADNFSEQQLLQAIDDAHIHGKKLYLTVNTLLKEQELEKELYSYLLPYYEQGLDAVIVQDIGAFRFIKEHFPKLSIHTSTQMTVCSRYGAELMKELGADRVVTAREMSFAEIKDISEHVAVEIESFVHGALCYCFSGQCLLSSMLGGRSGNRGRCAQPCRLPYEVYDARQKKVKAAPFVLSPKDLCTIEFLPQLAESGIHSFKIEGRMKQAEYAAGVVSVYRKYLDIYLEHGAHNYHVLKEDMQKLYDFGNRSGFTKGYYEKHNGRDMITFEKPNHAKGNGALQEKVRESYCNYEIKEKINGILRLSQNLPATLEVSFGNICCEVAGDVVQPAQKQPLSEEKVRENMEKTGNTPFVFEHLDIVMDGNIFMPLKALNKLRRDALLTLQQQFLEQYKRRESVFSSFPQNKVRKKQNDTAQELYLSVSVENRRQLQPVLAHSAVCAVYLDAACYIKDNFAMCLKEDVQAVHSAGKSVYFVFPTVFRKQTSDFYESMQEVFSDSRIDGVVVKSYDALYFAKKYVPDMELIFDANLYSYNNLSVKQQTEWNPLRITAPVELNRRELFERENTGSEIQVYGYLPLMTSAQCVHANTSGCDKKTQITYLKDRYGKFFPVKNHCAECYNTIYNTTPLMLFGYRKELCDAGFRFFRISFTIEDAKETANILQIYQSVFADGTKNLSDVYQGEYTNGHYKRGVE